MIMTHRYINDIPIALYINYQLDSLLYLSITTLYLSTAFATLSFQETYISSAARCPICLISSLFRQTFSSVAAIESPFSSINNPFRMFSTPSAAALPSTSTLGRLQEAASATTRPFVSKVEEQQQIRQAVINP